MADPGHPGHPGHRALPLWAAFGVAAGYDGQPLTELAGLHGNDPHDVRCLLDLALAADDNVHCGRHDRLNN